MTRLICIVCNALDDDTRLQRRISTDSPAASRKVFQLARALRGTGVRVVVLSYGRGRQDGSGDYFAPYARRVGSVPVVYLPFLHRPRLSEALSMLAPLAPLARLRRSCTDMSLLFYNRPLLHLPALLFARVLGIRTFLDLEDGEVGYEGRSRAQLTARICRWTFDRVCSGGALLACSALGGMTNLRPTMCYYGTIDSPAAPSNWEVPEIVAIFGGTISESTGAGLLLDVIRQLRQQRPEWCRRLRIAVTGQGDCADRFKSVAAESGPPFVEFHGRTTDTDYAAILARCRVGLALKPATGLLADSTFPSKVVELASAGLLVVSTDISDVRLVLSDGAVYLVQETTAELIHALRNIVEDRRWAESVALAGSAAVAAHCAPSITGPRLISFLAGDGS